MSGLSLLLRSTPRVPAYLAPAVARLEADGKRLAAMLGELLRRKVTLDRPSIRRSLSTVPDAETILAFDATAPGAEMPQLRFMVPHDVMATVAKIIFGGTVTEPVVQRQLAEALSGRLATIFDDTSGDGGFAIRAARPEALDTRPVITARYTFSIDPETNLEIWVEASRHFTDGIAPPPARPETALIDAAGFPARAVLSRTVLTVGQIVSWSKGTTIPFPKADLGRITVEAGTFRRPVTLGAGEMGADGDRRCLRLQGPAQIPPRPQSANAGTGAATSTQTPKLDLSPNDGETALAG